MDSRFLNRPIDENKLAVLSVYEDLLLGNGALEKEYIADVAGNKDAIRYICEAALIELCNFDAEQASNYLDTKLLKQFHLDKLYTMIRKERSTMTLKSNMISYILSVVYPDSINYSLKEHCIDEYERVNHLGKYKGEEKRAGYADDFFSGEHGDYYFRVCLNYAVEHILSSYSEEERYLLFTNKHLAKEFLDTCNLPTKTGYKDYLDLYHFFNDNPNEVIYRALRIMND